MTGFFENSVIFSWLSKVGRTIAEKWNDSLAGWYVTRNFNDIKTGNSVVHRFAEGIFNKIFSLKIGGEFGQKLKDSVILNLLSHYELGVYAMFLLAPIVPTMVCVAIVLLTFLSFFLHSIIKEDMNIRLDSLVVIILLLVVLFFIYSLTSYARTSSLKIFAIYMVFMLFAFMVAACGSNRCNLKRMVLMFVLSGTIVSLYGIYQQFFGNNLGHAWLDEEMFEGISVRVYSTLGNPNVLGEYLLLLMPICGAMIYGSKKWYAKLFYLFALGCSGLCLIFTQSRGCWLGIMLVAFIFAMFIDRRLLLLGIIGLMLLPMVLPQSIIERFGSIGNMDDSSTSYRVYIWFGTLRLLKDYWLTGIGIGQEAFNKVYPYYSYNTIIAPHAHNLYLQILTETGIVGIVTFIATMIVSLKKMVVGYINGKDSVYGILCAATIAGLMGFLLQGMFDYVWYNYRVFAMFWMMIGLGIASRRCVCGEDFTHNK